MEISVFVVNVKSLKKNIQKKNGLMVLYELCRMAIRGGVLLYKIYEVNCHVCGYLARQHDMSYLM